LTQIRREKYTFEFAFIEGFVWGLAVWIKPHVLVPAIVIWLVSLAFRPRRTILPDFLGTMCGGVLAGGLGLVWLVQSGAWPYFLEIFTQWNPEYNVLTWSELPQRVPNFIDFFPPWGVFHV